MMNLFIEELRTLKNEIFEKENYSNEYIYRFIRDRAEAVLNSALFFTGKTSK